MRGEHRLVDRWCAAAQVARRDWNAGSAGVETYNQPIGAPGTRSSRRNPGGDGADHLVPARRVSGRPIAVDVGLEIECHRRR